jgi:hypothetical protein
MFSAVTGKRTDFSIRLDEEPSKGVTSFWFGGFDGGHNTLLVGEGKVRPSPQCSWPSHWLPAKVLQLHPLACAAVIEIAFNAVGASETVNRYAVPR